MKYRRRNRSPYRTISLSTLDAADVRRLEALGPLDGLELHLVTLGQAAEALGDDGSVMDEQIRSILLRDETKTLRVIEPLNSTRLHRIPHVAARPLGLFSYCWRGLICDEGSS